MGTLSPDLQRAVVCIAAWVGALLHLPTVTVLSIFQKAIATFPSHHQVLSVGQVEETHATSLLEVALQLPLAAGAEDTWEGVSSGRCHDTASLFRGGLHAAALAVMAHAEVVANLVGHGGCCSNGML